MTRKDTWFRNRLIRDGIYRAIHEAMAHGPVYIMGEGSHMKVHFDAPQIERDFPGRVATLPISEDGNSNFAVGMSLAGCVPIVDVISSDFLYRTMDGICNTMAKAGAVGHARTMIVRAEFLIGGPTSGQRIEALFAHVPGLHVAVPSNPLDAYRMMQAALARKGVTVFFEDRMIEDAGTLESYSVRQEVPIGAGDAKGARPVCEGRRVTVASYGLTQRRVEQIASGLDVASIDLRWLYPLDVETVLASVRKTGRLLVVEPDTAFLGIGAELVAQVAERLPGCKVARLGAPHATIPASRDLHDAFIPTTDAIRAAVEAFQ